VNYAGFWIRTAAYLIDLIVVFLIYLFPLIIFSVTLAVISGMGGNFTPEQAKNMGGWFGFITMFFLQWVYFTVMESSERQATFGKKWLGLIVADEGNNRISYSKANARYWSKYLSAIIFGAGYFMVAFSQKRQGLHDKIAKTFVIKSEPTESEISEPSSSAVRFEKGRKSYPAAAPDRAIGNGFKYAGFWIRFWAYLLDCLILSPILYIEGYVSGYAIGTIVRERGGDIKEALKEGLMVLLPFLILIALVEMWLFYSFSESSNWQGTIGKKILGLKVVDEEGRRIEFSQASKRFWWKIWHSLLLCIGFFTIAFDEKKQGLYDKSAKTLVIQASEEGEESPLKPPSVKSSGGNESYLEMQERLKGLSKTKAKK